MKTTVIALSIASVASFTPGVHPLGSVSPGVHPFGDRRSVAPKMMPKFLKDVRGPLTQIPDHLDLCLSSI